MACTTPYSRDVLCNVLRAWLNQRYEEYLALPIYIGEWQVLVAIPDIMMGDYMEHLEIIDQCLVSLSFNGVMAQLTSRQAPVDGVVAQIVVYEMAVVVSTFHGRLPPLMLQDRSSANGNQLGSPILELGATNYIDLFILPSLSKVRIEGITNAASQAQDTLQRKTKRRVKFFIGGDDDEDEDMMHTPPPPPNTPVHPYGQYMRGYSSAGSSSSSVDSAGPSTPYGTGSQVNTAPATGNDEDKVE
jgi:hypothetical protein